MLTVDIEAAQAQLSDLINQAVAGEDVVISCSGQPVARLVPLTGTVAAAKRRLGILAGRLTIPADFDAPLAPEVLSGFEGG